MFNETVPPLPALIDDARLLKYGRQLQRPAAARFSLSWMVLVATPSITAISRALTPSG